MWGFRLQSEGERERERERPREGGREGGRGGGAIYSKPAELILSPELLLFATGGEMRSAETLGA